MNLMQEWPGSVAAWQGINSAWQSSWDCKPLQHDEYHEKEDKVHHKQEHFTVKAATANVTTFFPKELKAAAGAATLDQLTRVVVLAKQMVSKSVGIVGLQETRVQLDGVVDAHDLSCVLLQRHR